MKRYISYLLLFAFLACSSPTKVSEPDIKTAPEHLATTNDPQLNFLIEEYKRLAKVNNIEFDDEVTIGFSNINNGRVIGECTRSSLFREVDIDKGYWNNASWHSKITLVFHELNHCYCTRDHDWGEEADKVYPEVGWLQDILDKVKPYRPFYLAAPGFFDDNCPLSIMHPYILDDKCLETHYGHYVKEMFLRCDPW